MRAAVQFTSFRVSEQTPIELVPIRRADKLLPRDLDIRFRLDGTGIW